MAKKWNYEFGKYSPFKEPKGSTMYADDVKDIVVCPECQEKFRYGDGHSSLVIHSRFGVPFVVCEECHEWEIMDYECNVESRCPN